MRQIFYVCGLAAAILTFSVNTAHAQTVAAGPYYATPSWDQTLACTTPATCPRFVVLSNMTGDAVLDRETGLLWEKTPQAAEVDRVHAVQQCLQRQIGGRMGWRVPAGAELFSLIDTNNIPPFILPAPAALPPGHPFVGVNATFWSTTADGAPVRPADGGFLSVAMDFAILQSGGASALRRVWCVRGPGGDSTIMGQ
jgi:hypothetical protein